MSIEIVPMAATGTAIDGLWRISTKSVTDERGTVREFFRTSGFTDAGVPVPDRWAQVNMTWTHQGGIRGLHGEAMTKLVGVAAGSAFGAYVDARPDSPTRGAVVTVPLDVGVQVLVPAGVLNGFQAVSDGGCQYLYCFDAEWLPGMAGTAVTPLDPALGIAWPLAPDVDDPSMVSVKDRTAPTLADVLVMGGHRMSRSRVSVAIESVADADAPVVVVGEGFTAENIRRAERLAGRPARTASDVWAAGPMIADLVAPIVVLTAPYLATPVTAPEKFDATEAFVRVLLGCRVLILDLAPSWTGTAWATWDWIDVLTAAQAAGWTSVGSGDRAGELTVVMRPKDAQPAQAGVVGAYEQRLADLSAENSHSHAEIALMRHQLLRSTDRIIGVEAELSTLRYGVDQEVDRLKSDVAALRARIAELLASRSWRVGQTVLAPVRRLRG